MTLDVLGGTCGGVLGGGRDCGRPTTEVVVTVNGFIIDTCSACARVMCDPLIPTRQDS